MEIKFMTREDLEYMMIDLHVICLMKDEEIKTLKETNEKFINDRQKLMRENEQLRKDNNEAVLSLAKEKARLKDLLVDRDKQIKNWINYYKILHEIKNEQVKENKQLKKQIDELVCENSKLGEYNIHMYVRECEKLMRENEQLRRQIDDLSDTCSEQLETIATLQKTKNKQAETIKNKDATIEEINGIRYNLEDELSIAKYDLGNLKIKLKTTQEEKTTMAKDLDIFIDTIKQLDKKLQVAMKDNKAYESRIKKLEQKIFDEQLDRVGECAKCSHSGCATCKTNPPCECDTESKPMFEDDSCDCRPRKQ